MSASECPHMTIINSTFMNNTASKCTLCVSHSKISLLHTIISENVGNSSIVYLVSTHINVSDGLTYSFNNGSFLIKKSIMTLHGTSMFEGCIQNGMNTASAENYLQAEGTLTIIQSKVILYGTTYFLDNKSNKCGGALYVFDSQLQLLGHLTVARNFANNGGGAFLYFTKLVSCGIIDITANKAVYGGGGIYAISTTIVLTTGMMPLQGCLCHGLLNVTNNTAEVGGGMHLAVNSKLSGVESSTFHYAMVFASNSATSKGGAIFVNDSTYTEVCASTSFANYDMQTECFFQALYDDGDIGKHRQTLTSQHLKFMDNLAHQGPILYGGLLDRCTVSPSAKVYTCGTKHPFYGLFYFQNESGMNLNDKKGIASDSLRICFCCGNEVNCDQPLSINVKKGIKFKILIAVVDQVSQTAFNSVTIGSYLSEKSSTLGKGQQQQHTKANQECNELNFTISSHNDSVSIILYIEDSACEDSGLSRNTINVNFVPCTCPIGFQKVRSNITCECECHEKLKQYVHMCEPLNQTFQKKQNSWIGYFNSNNDSGYLIYPNCPYDFCVQPMNVNII